MHWRDPQRSYQTPLAVRDTGGPTVTKVWLAMLAVLSVTLILAGGAGVTEDPDDHFDEVEIIFCYGGARPCDTHLASTIHCIDDEIIDWLERHERRRHAPGS